MTHPSQALLGAQAYAGAMPVCDHYCGVAARMRKSLLMQTELSQEFGACVFDVTLDCEDGAPVGGEKDHAELVAELVLASAPNARVAARVHPVDHPAFAQDMAIIVGKAGHKLSHIMLPKVESVQDLAACEKSLQALAAQSAQLSAAVANLKLHALIESPLAVHHAFDIAAHPRIASLSFGLMDFVSAHGGAIPASAMTLQGQFDHPLVLRAKLNIATACHAHGKVPSHCVVTEFNDTQAIAAAAKQASQRLGYTRMWSIHPNQIRPIVAAFAPSDAEIDAACLIITRAAEADWAPISVGGQLQDRASYRYFWQVLQRAHQTGRHLPEAVQVFFNPAA